MIEQILGKTNTHGLKLFSADEVKWLEERIFQRNTKNGKEFAVNCFVRGKDIKLTPEEVVRQLFAHRLVDTFGYPVSRLAFEFLVFFGRETKRADIVVRDKDDLNVPYIIVETKKPNGKDGREQLKSYTLATGATMAVWTNGESITYHQRKNPNFFEDIPGIPSAGQSLADILNKPFTLDDLIREDKLTKTGKSLKDLVLEMEDEVLANAGVDVFEEVFKLIFAKLYDEKTGAQYKGYNLKFRNSGQSDTELKKKIEELFKEACGEWPGVFPDDAKIALTPPHLSICVSSLETVKLFNSNLDVVDDAFEYLMNKSSKGEKGQYFTPRYVIDMCVRMLNPKPTETMIDTAAGSSGFPVHTIFHVWREMQLAANRKVSHLFTSAPKGKEEIEYVRNKVFAIDFDEKTVRVARTLNLIAGDGHTNVLHLNTLDFGRWDTVTKDQAWIDIYNEGYKKLRKLDNSAGYHEAFDFDIVMANPPFAGEIKEGQLLSRYELGSKKGKPQKSVSRDILFIERNINFLGPGGRMAIVLPQGRFNNATDKEIRRFIADKCRILAVIGLDGNTFKPHTGTKTSVLFVQRWQEDRNQPNFNPKREDYTIFFATQRREGKNSRGDKLYWTADKSGITTDPKLALLDQYGHPIVYHDLFATYNYVWDEKTKTNRVEQLTPNGIAEAFAQFAAREKLSFFSLIPFDKARYGELLKGLEISEVGLRDIEFRTPDFRTESEYFTQELIALDRLIDSKDFVPLKEVSVKISDGTHFTPDYVNEGVPFLSAINVKSNVFDPDAGFQHITKEAHHALYKRCDPREGDVLVRKVGAGERMACVIPRLDYQFSIFVSVAMIRVNGIDPYYLSTFINSRIGQQQLLRFNKGIGQPDLHLEDLARLQVFRASEDFQSKIAEAVIKASDLIKKAAAQYREAEQMLLAELGFANWSPTEEAISVKDYSDFVLADRFDAEYFQPKYEDIDKKIRRYRGGVVAASDALVSGLVKEDADTAERYVELADIGANGEITGCMSAVFGELPSRARQRIEVGQVIVSSIEGSLDKCALVTSEYCKALCSTGFHRFYSTKINAETMLLLFKSWPIQQLMKRGCSGTILCGILPCELANVPLPLVDSVVQRDLAAKVQSSFALRAESKQLLDLAKQVVEIAIEQGEQKAMTVLNKEN